MYRWYLVGVMAAGLAGCLTFVVAYAIRSRGAWRRSDAGRFMMVGQTNLGTLFALILTNQLFNEWPGRRLITAILFTAYVIETWWPLRLLIKAQGRNKDLITRTTKRVNDD